MTETLDALKPAFATALRQSWSAATCWPGVRRDYRRDGSNPSWGQCLISTLAAWADRGFSEDILPGLVTESGKSPVWHFRLGTQGADIDPTWQQFSKDAAFRRLSQTEPLYRTVILGSLFEAAAQADLVSRLALLLDNMKKTGYRLDGGLETDVSAAKIITQAQARFAHVLKTP